MIDPEMTELEERLRTALGRVDAPEGFASRVLARAKATEGASVLHWPRGPRAWATGAMAALLLLTAMGGAELHARHEREAAARAERQFDTAMRVTTRALERTRERLGRAGLGFPSRGTTTD